MKGVAISKALTVHDTGIGKAGFHLEKGASFPYNGREIHVSPVIPFQLFLVRHSAIIQVDTYEVLVPAFQPARYRICDSDRIARIPRIHRSVPAVASSPVVYSEVE